MKHIIEIADKTLASELVSVYLSNDKTDDDVKHESKEVNDQRTYYGHSFHKGWFVQVNGVREYCTRNEAIRKFSEIEKQNTD